MMFHTAPCHPIKERFAYTKVKFHFSSQSLRTKVSNNNLAPPSRTRPTFVWFHLSPTRGSISLTLVPLHQVPYPRIEQKQYGVSNPLISIGTTHRFTQQANRKPTPTLECGLSPESQRLPISKPTWARLGFNT